MLVTTKEGDVLELLYEDGYYTVGKMKVSAVNTPEDGLSEVSGGKEYKHSLKTYAHVTGLIQRCEAWGYICDKSEPLLIKTLKLESGISRAKGKRIRKELKGNS